MRHAGVLANLSGLQVPANASDLQAKPDGHATMAAVGSRKRPASDEEDSSDGSKKEAVKKPRQINAWDNDDDDADADVQLEELVMVPDKAAAEQEDEDDEEDDNHDNKDNNCSVFMPEQAEESDANQVAFVAEGNVAPVVCDEEDGRNGSKKEVVKRPLQIDSCNDDDDDNDKDKESEETAMVHNAIAREQLEKTSFSVEDDDEDNKNGIMEEEEHAPGQDSDHSWQNLAKARTGHHIPTCSKQTKSAVGSLSIAHQWT
jgi:hypothetical protein